MIPQVPSSDEDLLSECEVGKFRFSGSGGQNANKRDTAVRLRHIPTGIVGIANASAASTATSRSHWKS